MNEEPIYVIARWQVKEGQLATVLTLLPEVVAKSLVESGNLFYKVSADQTDGNTLLLLEGYRDKNALDEHRNSTYFQSIVIEKIIPLLAKREVTIATALSF